MGDSISYTGDDCCVCVFSLSVRCRSGAGRGPILHPGQAVVRPVGPSGALLDASSPDVVANGLVTAPSGLPAIHLNVGTSATACFRVSNGP